MKVKSCVEFPTFISSMPKVVIGDVDDIFVKVLDYIAVIMVKIVISNTRLN
ncbi:MAG: hypothetical protein AAF693_19370 [Bacteroidota bacterium]